MTIMSLLSKAFRSRSIRTVTKLSERAPTCSRLVSTNIDKDIDRKKSAQQNLQEIDRQSYENAQSGTDDAVANQPDVAYDSTASTSPKAAIDRAGKASQRYNPLEVSAANPDVSLAGTDVREVTRRPDGEAGAVFYRGTSMAKSEVKISEKKVRAGTDTRKSQRPQDVAKEYGGASISPGSR